jgi:nucleoside-diphosphate-sugar epimerase
VTGTTRSSARADEIRALGAAPALVDVFDTAALGRALEQARPEVVVHELTDLPDELDPRGGIEQFAGTNRLRTEGTRNLVDAAVAAGARRIVAQSVALA